MTRPGRTECLCIGDDFDFIARAYGIGDVDTEELIATRDW
jgi:hypothetical protein